MAGRVESTNERNNKLAISYRRNTVSELRHLVVSIPDRFRYSGKNDSFKMYLPGENGLKDAAIIFQAKNYVLFGSATKFLLPDITAAEIAKHYYENYSRDSIIYKYGHGVVEYNLPHIKSVGLWILSSKSVTINLKIILNYGVYEMQFVESGNKISQQKAITDLGVILDHIQLVDSYKKRKSLASSSFFSTINPDTMKEWQDYALMWKKEYLKCRNMRIDLVKTMNDCRIYITKSDYKEALQKEYDSWASNINLIYNEVLKAVTQHQILSDEEYVLLNKTAQKICSKETGVANIDGLTIIGKTNTTDVWQELYSDERIAAIEKAKKEAVKERKRAERELHESRKRARAESRVNPLMREAGESPVPMKNEVKKLYKEILEEIKDKKRSDIGKVHLSMLLEKVPNQPEIIWAFLYARYGVSSDDELFAIFPKLSSNDLKLVIKAIEHASYSFAESKLVKIYSIAERIKPALRKSFIPNMLIWDFDDRESLLDELVDRSVATDRYDIVKCILDFLKLPEESDKYDYYVRKCYLSSDSIIRKLEGYRLLRTIYPDCIESRVLAAYEAIDANAEVDVLGNIMEGITVNTEGECFIKGIVEYYLDGYERRNKEQVFVLSRYLPPESDLMCSIRNTQLSECIKTNDYEKASIVSKEILDRNPNDSLALWYKCLEDRMKDPEALYFGDLASVKTFVNNADDESFVRSKLPVINHDYNDEIATLSNRIKIKRKDTTFAKEKYERELAELRSIEKRKYRGFSASGVWLIYFPLSISLSALLLCLGVNAKPVIILLGLFLLVEIVSSVVFRIKKSRANAQFDHERQQKKEQLSLLEECYKSEENELLQITEQINNLKEKLYVYRHSHC